MKYRGLPLRHEDKYQISYPQYEELRARLRLLMAPDSHSRDGGYLVRSLYFDDVYESALWEKEAGVFSRAKYRVRTYNNDPDFIRLEKKIKTGSYISKVSGRINQRQLDMLLSGRPEFLLKGGKVEQDFYAAIRTRVLSPRIIVDYMREAYVCGEGNVRITFDSKLAAGVNTFDMFDPALVTISAMEPRFLILEVKYDDFLPKYIAQALQSVATRMAISKYVLCRATKDFTLRKEVWL